MQYCVTFSLLKYKLGLVLCNLFFLEYFLEIQVLVLFYFHSVTENYSTIYTTLWISAMRFSWVNVFIDIRHSVQNNVATNQESSGMSFVMRYFNFSHDSNLLSVGCEYEAGCA